MLASKSQSAVGMLNAAGESALHEACLRDRPQNVELLLRWGVDPECTKSHRYPIHCAASLSSVRSAISHLLMLLLAFCICSCRVCVACLVAQLVG